MRLRKEIHIAVLSFFIVVAAGRHVVAHTDLDVELAINPGEVVALETLVLLVDVPHRHTLEYTPQHFEAFLVAQHQLAPCTASVGIEASPYEDVSSIHCLQ